MRTRPFGRTGVDVSVIGQGTWQLRDKQAAEEALRRGLDLGMTHIDTAELYTGSEEVVGRAIHGRRDEVFLVSKVLPSHASYDGVLQACGTSLGKLGTDYLDLYLLHWRSGRHPLEDTFRAMGELQDDGRIRHIGVSNFDVSDLEEAKSILGPGRIMSNQVLYHLGDRGVETDVLPWCQREGVAVVGYSPFGSGRFPRPDTPHGRVLTEVAREAGCTRRQAALAFLVREDGVFTIPKAEKLEHVEDNAAAGDVVLSDDAVARLDEAFPVEPGMRVL